MTDLFFILAVIDFESERDEDKDFDWIMRNYGYPTPEELRDEMYRSAYPSLLFRAWQKIWKISPNFYFFDWVLSKTLGKILFSAGPVTIFGYDAMFFAHQLKCFGGVLTFCPPCSYPFGHRKTLGKLFWSPDGWSGNPSARFLYGKGLND
jgi:hypothetical protein